MKVRDLIEMLQSYDGDADVLLATQPHYPFESEVDGICARADAMDDEEDDSELPAGSKKSDVIICVGSQVRHGSKSVWDVCHG